MIFIKDTIALDLVEHRLWYFRVQRVGTLAAWVFKYIFHLVVIWTRRNPLWIKSRVVSLPYILTKRELVLLLRSRGADLVDVARHRLRMVSELFN